MSLYNAIHGVNEHSAFLMEMLGLTKEQVGRYRDCYIAEDEKTKEKTIIVYTRNGGGNREAYQPVINELKKHRWYSKDWDDDFDCTYAYIEFRIPDRNPTVRHILDVVWGKTKDKRAPMEKFRDLMQKMESGDQENLFAVEGTVRLQKSAARTPAL